MKKLYIFVIIWTLLAGLALGLPGAAPPTAAHPPRGDPAALTEEWVIECVKCPKYSRDNPLSQQLDAAGWHIETVDTNVGDWGSGGRTSLAIDSNGYSHISYYSATTEDLKYAYQDSTGWHIQTVDSTDSVGEYASLVLDSSGYPHISYCDSGWPRHLKYAYQNATGWHVEEVDGGDIGTTSLKLGGNDYPHISFFEQFYGDLKYANKDTAGWHFQTVHAEVYGFDVYTSLALDGNGYPHISYYDWGNSNLNYAYRDATDWHILTVDSLGDVGHYTSLALKDNSYPHISYYDRTNGTVKYAYKDPTGWHGKTVDTELGELGSTSLALDGNGYPHISYYNTSTGDLKYAYQNASGWHVHTVDSQGNVGKCTSLAIDNQGYPRISYYDESNDALKYAYFLPTATFTVSKTVNPATVYNEPPGELVTYEVVFTNQGSVSSVLADIRDMLPEGFVFQGMVAGSDIVVPPSGTMGDIAWTGPFSMPGQSSLRLIYQVRATTTLGTYENSVTATVIEGLPLDAPARATVTVVSSGDDYEPDDTCTQASSISTDGAPQHHTFHDQGDADWVSFQATSGATYILETANVGPDADTILELYDACDQAPLASDDNAFGSTARLVWTSSADGTYYLKALNHDPNRYGDEVYYDLSVRRQTGGAAAIIVAGHNDSWGLQDNIDHCTNTAYRSFLLAGVPEGQIYYLNPNPGLQDPDEDGVYDDVDAVSTAANLQTALETWAVSHLSDGDQLFLYLMDHGGVDAFATDGEGDVTTPKMLDAWLNSLEEATGCQVNVIIEACHSGSFIDRVPDVAQEISKPGRVIIASTGRMQNAYASPQGAYFSDAFWTSIQNSSSLWVAFQDASAAVEATGLWQTPWLDDDGDATPNDPDDGQVASGRGLAAFFGGRPPVVDAVTVTLGTEGDGLIQAAVRDDYGVGAVWAVIVPPSFQEPPPGEAFEWPELNLPEVQLLKNGSLYERSYSGFDETGEYRVMVYARDGDGNQASPAAETVRTGYAVYLPLVVRGR